MLTAGELHHKIGIGIPLSQAPTGKLKISKTKCFSLFFFGVEFLLLDFIYTSRIVHTPVLSPQMRALVFHTKHACNKQGTLYVSAMSNHYFGIEPTIFWKRNLHS